MSQTAMHKVKRCANGEAFSPALLQVIAKAVHPTRGLITGIFEQDRHPIASGIRLTQAVIVPPTYFRTNAPVATQTIDVGTGAAFDRESACWAAIGEGIERYAASIYFPEQITWSTVEDLPGKALDLEPLIRTKKNECSHGEASLPRAWMLGMDLVNQTPMYVPAAMTVLGYEARERYEILGQYVSTGLACGTKFDDAVLRGLFENIERDAFASNWLLGRCPPRLEMDGDAEKYFQPEVLRALENPDLKVSIYLLAVSFGVTVVLGVGEHPELGYGVVGAAAALSPVRAAEKAIIEVLHGWTGASAMTNRPPFNDFANFSEASDHAAYYNNAQRWPVVARTCGSTEIIPLSRLIGSAKFTGDSRTDLATLTRSIHEEGYTAAAVNLSTDDVVDLGLNVARVVVPGLQPLVFGPSSNDVPDQRRLNVWRERWGLSPDSPITTEPHPFP